MIGWCASPLSARIKKVVRMLPDRTMPQHQDEVVK